MNPNSQTPPDDVRITRELSFKADLCNLIVRGANTFSAEYVKKCIDELFNLLNYNEDGE